MTRVIIAGSRKFDNYELLREKCDKIIPEEAEIISGGCRGADFLGERYALERGYPLVVFPADWKKFGNRAGPLRNGQMAAYAKKADKGILIAFPIGESRGTRNMINQAKEHGLDVYVIEGQT